MIRPYTGFDSYATATQPGLAALRDLILFLNQGAITHLGSFVKRPQRGHPGVPSVHGTGRACDLGYQYRKDIEGTMTWLVTFADELGLEFLADYYPKPYGRAWRCDRDSWRTYTRPTISGAPGGKWIHLEISPTMAASKQAMDAAITRCL